MTNIKIPCKDIDELTPSFKRKVELFIKEAWKEVFITETYRSQERQIYLYWQWRTRKWNKVTWTLSSYHKTRKAIDIAFRWDKLYPSNINEWAKIADIAAKYWIVWGYDLRWKDLPHFQDNWIPYKETKEIKEKRPNKKKKTKYSWIMERALKQAWIKPIFNSHEWDKPLTEREIKELIDIARAREVIEFNKERDGR